MSIRSVGIILICCLVTLGCSTARAAVGYRMQDGRVPTEPVQWTFDLEPTGGMFLGETFSGTWVVRPEAGTASPPNALCQTGSAQFPALSLGNAVFNDLVLTARFKLIAGREDQAAGLIFRVQDRHNYYVLRTDGLDNTIAFYEYVGGRRSGLKETRIRIPSGQWHELRVEVVGKQFRGFLDGQLMVEATDDTFQAGQVGLWTMSDSVTCFDDVVAQRP